MEDLFRFIMSRPAQLVEVRDNTVPTRPSRDLHAKLREARTSRDPSSALKTVALAYIDSQQALKAIDQLKKVEELQKFIKKLSDFEDKSLDQLNSVIRNSFGVSARDLVSQREFNADRESLSDILVVNAILAKDTSVTSSDAAKFLRPIVIVDRVAGEDKTIEVKGGVKRAFQRSILLPSDVFPVPKQIPPRDPDSQPSEPDLEARKKTLRAERDRLFSTYSILTRVTPDHIALGDSEMSREGIATTASRSNLPPVASSEDVNVAAEGPSISEAPNGGFAARAVRTPLVLKPSLVESIGEKEKDVLKERGLDLTRVDLPNVVDRLSVELRDLDLALVELENMNNRKMVKVGETYLSESAIAVGPYFPGGFATTPTTRGNIVPIGIGDLLVVKQFLKKYEGRELAHVENILQGEFKERIHRRARTTEETITVETEEKREEERDQQTTERFELKTESSRVLKEDSSLKVGLSLSGSYGPVVEFKASTDFSSNTSREEATKVATSYSKDVTSRATSRLFERRREERILRTIEVFEEKNTHGVDNKSGEDHVVGQYQWIDKIYEAQVFNYGKRMLFDFMLPEPGVFLLHAFNTQPKAGSDLVKPLPFTLKPDDLSEWNYTYYVKQYEVVGVAPPPQPYITVSKAFEGVGKQGEGVTKAAEVPILDGYQAVRGNVTAWFNQWSGAMLDVSLGTGMHRFSDNGAWNEPLSNEVASIPFSMKTLSAEAFAVGMEINGQRTQRALDDWKLKTHGSILQAYQKQLRDYEEKLAALQVQAAQQIQGRNPVENQELIRTELKKWAISVFTAQHYDLFGAIVFSSHGYPQPDLSEAEAEGKYIRFFEQAFEWEQMMYFLYPYYWARKSIWLNRALLQDVDSLFADFLKAGSGRIVVSARPGFEKALAHYFDTGEIWDGGDLPDISSPLYVSIIEEIRERDEAPGIEVAQGDTWDVHLPTTLVILRKQAALPAWRKNAQGKWEPI